MAEIRNCKVLVIGAGPGGYVAAIRAGQRLISRLFKLFNNGIASFRSSK